MLTFIFHICSLFQYNDSSPYDNNEATRLLSRIEDGRPRTMGNMVESRLDSTQPLAEGSVSRGTS